MMRETLKKMPLTVSRIPFHGRRQASSRLRPSMNVPLASKVQSVLGSPALKWSHRQRELISAKAFKSRGLLREQCSGIAAPVAWLERNPTTSNARHQFGTVR